MNSFFGRQHTILSSFFGQTVDTAHEPTMLCSSKFPTTFSKFSQAVEYEAGANVNRVRHTGMSAMLTKFGRVLHTRLSRSARGWFLACQCHTNFCCLTCPFEIRLPSSSIISSHEPGKQRGVEHTRCPVRTVKNAADHCNHCFTLSYFQLVRSKHVGTSRIVSRGSTTHFLLANTSS